MASEHDKERQRCILEVARHGWSVLGTNPKTGYTKLNCACGLHRISIPRTPSDPRTFRRKAQHMIRVCSIQVRK